MLSQLLRFVKMKPASRYPADPRAVFVLLLSVFTGLTALALQYAPESLNAFLPHWGVITWGALLLVGSALALVGVALQGINGIILEQIGSVLVGVTTIFYSVLGFHSVGLDGLQTVGIILAWGLSCLWRWGQLQMLIVQTYHIKLKMEAREELRQELEDQS